MEREYVKVSKDIIDSILADDVYTRGGNMIVPSDTFISEHIIKKLNAFRVERVTIYRSHSILGNEYLSDKSISESQKQYIEDVNATKSILRGLASGKELDMDNVKTITDSVYERLGDVGSIIECINSIKVADQYTYSHSVNVAFYAMLLGKWMNLSKLQIKDLAMAGLLHDIGKTKISAEIINKKGPLNENEFEVIKRHPIYGYDIIKGFSDIAIDIKRAVILHHEKENGTGYPFGIQGNKKNLYAKIITAADIFDAITSERVYKEKQTPFSAFKEMEKIGYDIVDPMVMGVMFDNMPRYYIGSKVKLDNGEIGEVVYVPSSCAYAPVVKIKEDFVDFAKEKEALISELL
ncbi:HD-GYP domain-containing protein [Ruminiclostridium cellulolyticum]|uniref:Metal dependent phosphohydrolase n=1 Tax=Ruminiclostridium cellulolyticum (strain ATCC 35319 / DSM 5812 / JCM 6584 / H10) TaxID=394503 RepID=B8I6I7_RUMCH|nr:HD-GYP domain-containing protein [Ruminiclostridium cellulolyticum]ACL74879.1 metal dependent phosphohydrolase [Ruminiclostridium cellulolyticum H10]